MSSTLRTSAAAVRGEDGRRHWIYAETTNKRVDGDGIQQVSRQQIRTVSGESVTFEGEYGFLIHTSSGIVYAQPDRHA